MGSSGSNKAWLAALLVGAASIAQATGCPQAEVVQHGKPSFIAAPTFAASSQPASDAVSAILPKHWALKDPQRITTPVAWKAGTPWMDVLHTVAHEANACVSVNWADRTITLARATTRMPTFDSELLLEPTGAKQQQATVAHQPRSGVVALPAPSTIVPVAPHQIATVPDTTPIVPLPRNLADTISTSTSVTYYLRPGDTLRSTLKRWADGAGWTLVWNTDVDYTIDASATFPPGTTIKDAVRQTMHSFWERTRWLRATVYKNNVIVITGSSL